MQVIDAINRVTPWRIRRAGTRWRQRFCPIERVYRLELSRFGPFRIAYRARTVDEKVLAHSFDNDIFLSGVPEYQPTPQDIIIDVGAHIGTFALLAASRVPQGKVFAVEACKETYNYLCVNISLNGLTNVDATHVAMSNENGKTKLFYDDATGNWGHSIMQDWTGRGETVNTMTFADFMRAKSIVHANFAKFNCEGAEFPILLATPNDVLSRIDTVLVLYHEDIAAGYRHSQLLEKLDNCGFDTAVRHKGTGRGWLIGTQRKTS